MISSIELSVEKKVNGSQPNKCDFSKQKDYDKIPDMISSDEFTDFNLVHSSVSSNSLPRLPRNDKIIQNLPKTQYSLMSNFKALIPHLENPSNFYVSSIDDFEKAQDITTLLKEICSNLPVWEDAKFLKPVDYGNEGILGMEFLRPLTVEMAKIPPLAIHCTLNNIKPFPNLEWSEDSTVLFDNLTVGEGFNVCKIFSVENNLHFVDFFNSKNQSLWDVFIQKKIAVRVSKINSNINEFPQSHDEVDKNNFEDMSILSKTLLTDKKQIQASELAQEQKFNQNEVKASNLKN